MNCLIQIDVKDVSLASQELVKAMRKLHRDLKYCDACPLVDKCEHRSNFHSVVNNAIDEVNQEWNRPSWLR